MVSSSEVAEEMVPAAQLAAMEEQWLSAARCHIMAIERFGDLGIGVMQAIADGKSKREILDFVGDSLNACDHVDDESIALFKRAVLACEAEPVA